MSDEVYGQIPVFFADKDPIYPGNGKEFEIAIKSPAQGGLGGSRHYIPKHYPRRVYRYLDSGAVDLAIAEDADDFAAKMEAGWSPTPLAPPLPPPEKDVTKAEYEANMRTAKAELRNEELQKQMSAMQGQLAQLTALLSAKEPEKRGPGRPSKGEATDKA